MKPDRILTSDEASALPDLPAPLDLRTALWEAINDGVERVRVNRGVTSAREDHFYMIRGLQALRDVTADYERLFKDLDKLLVQIIEEEHLDAVGESDGIPTGNLRVPTAGGDINVTRDLQNLYDIDMEQVVSVLAAQTASAWERDGREPTGQPEEIAEFAIEVALTALSFVGAAKPKVTSVRALAEQLSRDGDDQLAKVARDSIRKTVKFKGIKVDRKAG